MPTYDYRALGRDGREVSGAEIADTPETLQQLLRGKGLLLVSSREVRQRRIPASVQTELFSYLAQLLGSGVTLDRSLLAVAEDAEKAATSALARQLRDALSRGKSLPNVLSMVGRFHPLVVPVVQAGEMRGDFRDSFSQLEQYLTREQDRRREIFSSLAYPLVLFFASIMIIVGLSIYVIPTFRELFANKMHLLPATTVFLFRFSDFIRTNGLEAFGLVGLLVAAMGARIKYHSGARMWFDRTVLIMPSVGRLLVLLEISKILFVLGVLVSHRVPLDRSIDIAASMSRNQQIRHQFSNVRTEIRGGQKLSAALSHIYFFPRVALRILSAGEEAGKIGESSQKAARILGDEATQRIKNIVRLLEPVMILIMGGAIGFVVAAMLQGVYSISTIS